MPLSLFPLASNGKVRHLTSLRPVGPDRSQIPVRNGTPDDMHIQGLSAADCFRSLTGSFLRGNISIQIRPRQPKLYRWLIHDTEWNIQPSSARKVSQRNTKYHIRKSIFYPLAGIGSPIGRCTCVHRITADVYGDRRDIPFGIRSTIAGRRRRAHAYILRVGAKPHQIGNRSPSGDVLRRDREAGGKGDPDATRPCFLIPGNDAPYDFTVARRRPSNKFFRRQSEFTGCDLPRTPPISPQIAVITRSAGRNHRHKRQSCCQIFWQKLSHIDRHTSYRRRIRAAKGSI
jgi:hypothetical protein